MDTTNHVELSRAQLGVLLAHLKTDSVQTEKLKALTAQLHQGGLSTSSTLELIDAIGALLHDELNQPLSNEIRLLLIEKIERIFLNTPEESKYVLSIDGLVGKMWQRNKQ